MKISSDPKLISAIHTADQACKTLVTSGKKDEASQLNEVIESIRNEKFVVGVIGSANRGKSTLINGLLGRQNDNLAPIGKFPATNVISVFFSSDEPSIRVIFQDGQDRQILEPEIRAFACEESNPNNHKNVKSIEAQGNFPGLESGVFLVDTPGGNNALDSQHGDILFHFLPRADALIFLIAADSPLVAAEQDLLRAIKGNDVKKVFFAVNKVDRVESGELDNDEINEGLAHNRKILEEVGFPNAKIFLISAKNYFEKKSDKGTEELIENIRFMIAKERIEILCEKLSSRTKSILQQSKDELSHDLINAKASEKDLISERKNLEAGKKSLQQGRSARERLFRQEWEEAFSEFESKLMQMRKDLNSEYTNLIDKKSSAAIPALSQTIHADVNAVFSERLKEVVYACEARISEAEKALTGSVQSSLINVSVNAEEGATIKSTMANSLKIVASTVPSIITGGVSVALPGLIGSLIASTAPTVVAATWNPLTWLSAAATGTGSVIVGSTSAAVIGALTVVAMPIAVGAFSWSAYKGYSTWKAVKAKEKNELKTSISKMIEEGCEAVQNQIRVYRKGCDKILINFESVLEQKLEETDNRLADLIKNRPSPDQIRMLESSVQAIENQLSLIDNSKEQNRSSKFSSTTDTLFNK